jgi:ABC-2 type transport system ATP-binding protein
MIEVKNLTKCFGRRVAVDNISFEVKSGEIVGFLGPNGAGKTTTIRVLTCYHPATSGAASVAGFDVFTESMDVRRVIGYLPESVPLYPEMRVREYLHFRGKLRGQIRSERNQAIDRVTTKCWLREVIDRPIGQLSKGFRQRVGLADALLHNPKVLILDEPTVGLDPAQIRETRSLIRALAQEHTVMLSSHILPEVEATCERVVIIHRGKIVASTDVSQDSGAAGAECTVIAEVRAEANSVESALQGIPGVRQVESNMVDGWTRVSARSGRDIREEVAQLAARSHWPLRELRREGASLEEFFVRIVSREAESPHSN